MKDYVCVGWQQDTLCGVYRGYGPGIWREVCMEYGQKDILGWCLVILDIAIHSAASFLALNN